MTLTETDTVLYLWTAKLIEFDSAGPFEWPPGTRGGDWLCILAVTADGQIKGEYRFRYSAGPGFDERDVINRYAFTGADTPVLREKAIDMCRELTKLEGFENESVSETRIYGDANALSAAILNHPNMIVRTKPENKKDDPAPTQRGAES